MLSINWEKISANYLSDKRFVFRVKIFLNSTVRKKGSLKKKGKVHFLFSSQEVASGISFSVLGSSDLDGCGELTFFLSAPRCQGKVDGLLREGLEALKEQKRSVAQPGGAGTTALG